MRIFVTGGAGYIGSHFVRSALVAGHDVLVYDNLSTGNRWAVPDGLLVVADLADSDETRKALEGFRADAIVHFAASMIVPESVRKPLEYFRNNVANTLNLLDEAMRCGINMFVFSSTAAVYGIPDTLPVKETALCSPINPYGQTKMVSEMMLADLAFSNPAFRYASLRYFNVAGADAGGKLGHAVKDPTLLITRALKTALGHYESLKVFGTDYPTPDGTCIRDYIHVEDLVDAHLLTLDYLSKGGQSQVMNCGYGHGASVLDVVKCAKEVTGVDFKVEYAPRREGDPAALVADSSRIKALLGWTAKHDDLREIVSSAWNWQRRFSGA